MNKNSVRVDEASGAGLAVSVFGLDYVRCVSAACLASRGHDVIGVDVNSDETVLSAVNRLRPDDVLFDLALLAEAAKRRGSGHYRGIGW